MAHAAAVTASPPIVSGPAAIPAPAVAAPPSEAGAATAPSATAAANPPLPDDTDDEEDPNRPSILSNGDQVILHHQGQSIVIPG